MVDSLSTERFFSVKTPGGPDLKADMENSICNMIYVSIIKVASPSSLYLSFSL